MNGKEQEGGGFWISYPRFLFLLSSASEGSLVVRRRGYCDPTSNVNWRKENGKSPPRQALSSAFPGTLRDASEVWVK